MLASVIMATALQIPLSEYLATSYRPDREYVDGEVRERNVGKYEHARLQALLAAWFAAHEKSWGIQVVTEQRVQVTPTRVRIPDVAVLPPLPQPDVIAEPPVLVMPKISPEESTASGPVPSPDPAEALKLNSVVRTPVVVGISKRVPSPLAPPSKVVPMRSPEASRVSAASGFPPS